MQEAAVGGYAAALALVARSGGAHLGTVGDVGERVVGEVAEAGVEDAVC